jgi:hypothetical protein
MNTDAQTHGWIKITNVNFVDVISNQKTVIKNFVVNLVMPLIMDLNLKRMNNMETKFDIRIRFAEDTRRWEDMPVNNRYPMFFFTINDALQFFEKFVAVNNIIEGLPHIKQVRINISGNSQGYYLD